jgi:hypothetical protein
MKTASFSTALSLLILSSEAASSSAFVMPSATSVRTELASSASDVNASDDSVMTAREARITGPLSTIAAATLLSNAGKAEAAINSSPDFDSSVRTFFPGAVPNTVVNNRAAERLLSRGYRPYNTILGSSLCSDEIDSTALSLMQQLQKSLTLKKDGGVFNLGGLGGVPFVGKSGFGAFLSHVPVSGKVIILYGPHVGISNEGVVGKVERVGQDKPSGACGAALGAYKAIKAGGRGPNDKFDYQEEFIIDELTPKLQTLLEQQKNSGAVNGFVNANTAITAVTCNMFDIVNDVLEEQLEASFKSPGFWDKVSEVTLLGGIVVNRGHGNGLPGGDDYFQPLQFKAVNANGEVDMWDQVFGDLKRKVV